MVQGFVRQSGGSVYFESELGSGATFRLLFRTIDEATEAANADFVWQPSSRTSGTRILVVEDESVILKSLQTMLYASEYFVRTASTGDQAWKLLCDDPNVNLVLSDVVMPGKLQGTDLAQNIKDAKLNIPVILMSGHAFTLRHEMNSQIASQFIHKPIRKGELIDAIEEAIDKPNSKARQLSIF